MTGIGAYYPNRRETKSVSFASNMPVHPMVASLGLGAISCSTEQQCLSLTADCKNPCITNWRATCECLHSID